MDSRDQFNSTRSGTGNPFAEKSYSDQFVRSATQPLARRTTRPLEVTPEVLQQQLGQAEEQVQLCRIIVDRFSPRVRILKAAQDQSKKATAAPAEVKKPAKGGFGIKKPGTAPSPAPGGALSPQEKALADKIATRLLEKPDLARRATIALTQFEDAARGVSEVTAKLAQLRMMDVQQAFAQLESLEISKLQGRIYPVCNFYEVFKDDDLLWQVFPPPNQMQNSPAPAPQPKRGFGRS